MDFYVSRDTDVGSDGKLLNPIDTFHAGPVGGPPPAYSASPEARTRTGPTSQAPTTGRRPTTTALLADPNCYGPIQSLTVNPLAPPTPNLTGGRHDDPLRQASRPSPSRTSPPIRTTGRA